MLLTFSQAWMNTKLGKTVARGRVLVCDNRAAAGSPARAAFLRAAAAALRQVQAASPEAGLTYVTFSSVLSGITPVGVRNRRLNIKMKKLLRVGPWAMGPVRAEHVAAAARAREPRLGRSCHTCVFHLYLTVRSCCQCTRTHSPHRYRVVT